MIELYKCEKCGTVYDDYDDCNKCENSHLRPNMWESQDRWDNALFEYAKGARLPKLLEVTSEVEWYDYNEESGKYKKRRFVGTYKLQDTAEVPIEKE